MSYPHIVGATIPFNKFPLADALRYLGEAGFPETEITIFPDAATSHFACMDAGEAEIENTVEVVKKSGIRVVALNLGAGYSPVPEKQQRFERGVVNTFRLASRLGANIVTVACGAIAEGEDRSQGLKKIADCYAGLARTAKEDHGIILSVEAPHKKSISETIDMIRSYWAVMPDGINCTLDVAHVTFGDSSMEEVIGLLGERVAQVHLRDAVPGNSLMNYGAGQVDFPAVYRMLDAAGYTGAFSMEFVGGEEPAETIRLLIDGKAYLTK